MSEFQISQADLAKAWCKPNALLSVMLGHHKWYVKPFIRFAPKFVCTFTDWKRREDHGYIRHHPLEFLYRIATWVARKDWR